jgi:hypothetical protein
VPDLITRALEIVLVQAQGEMTALVPVGTSVAGGLVILSIVLLGASLASGQTALVRPIVGMCAASAGTLWGISTWPTIVGDTFHASDTVLSMLTGGTGLVGLFTLGGDTAARVIAEGSAVSVWSPTSWAQAIVAGFCALIILLGMAWAGMLVIMAQIEMLIGAVLAPLLLPGLAFGLTSQLGWGAIYHLVRGALRVMATGAVAALMAKAVATVVSVPGTDTVMSFSEMAQLVVLSLGTAAVCLFARGIAGSMVGSPGVLGLASVGRVLSLGAAAVGPAGSAAISAGSATAAAAAAKGGRGAAAAASAGGTGAARVGGSAGGGQAGGGVPRSSQTGSAFQAGSGSQPLALPPPLLALPPPSKG